MEAERGEGGVLAQEHLQQQHRPAQHQRQQDVDWAQGGDLVFTKNMQVMIHTLGWNFSYKFYIWKPLLVPD